MKTPVERTLLLIVAAISGATPFALDPITAGLALAALNVALAMSG